VGFYPSSPWLLGCAGSGNLLSLWDLSRESTIQNRFRPRMESSDGVLAEAPSVDEKTSEDLAAMMAMKEPDDKPTSETSDKKESGGRKKKGKAKAKRKAHRKS